MIRLQFRVLYRQFLFRMVDLEILSSDAQGDASRLMAQCGAVLVFLGWMQAVMAVLFSPRGMTPLQLLITFWSKEHSLISITMLAVGLFAVLSWDSMFPDRRDVMVLAPLPVRPHTLFVAKLMALGSSLGLVMAALNLGSGTTWPFWFGGFRAVGAFWITVLAAGGFEFCVVLAVQGLAAQLPRRWFLRISSFLQLAAFAVFVSVFLLEPGAVTPHALADPRKLQVLASLPSFWFWGLFHSLNGTMRPEMAVLAQRAMLGLAIAGATAVVAFLLAYFRTIRRIAEEPDILPGRHGIRWLPAFGKPVHTAIAQFAMRTLMRSRQHRMIVAFYLGIGFAISTVYLGSILVQRQLQRGDVHPYLVASTLMLIFAVLGTRVAIALPLDLRANWIFRVLPVPGPAECLKAGARALCALAVAPACAAAVALLWFSWPTWMVAGHAAVLALDGAILVYLCLRGFHKIPFACSYLPGKVNLMVAAVGGWGLLLLIMWLARYEKHALYGPVPYGCMILILSAAAFAARRIAVAAAHDEESAVRFEEKQAPTVQVLGITRDGVTLVS